MSINWEVLSIIVLILIVLVALAVVTISYVRHWAARHDISENNLGEGKYFKRYVSAQDQVQHREAQANILIKKKKSIKRIKYTTISGLVMSLLAGTIISLYANRDSLANKVTLNKDEIDNFIFDRHQWRNVYPEKIPNLNGQLKKIRSKGLVLLGNTLTSGDARLDSIKGSAKLVWEQFADEHNLSAVSCDWNDVAECMASNYGAVFVLLPDFWQAKTINEMLEAGASILAYDAPLQVTEKNYSIYDLKFSPAMDKSSSVFVLAGDKELSLGFDAGTIIDMQSNSHFYEATSSRPQALAIDGDHVAGGAVLKTRLYVEAVKDGRFVWMDFSPNKQDHMATINAKYFEGVLASIFRYLNKESYQSIATWPSGKRFAALIEEDTEDKFDAAERVSDFFLENNYPITWYMLSTEAQKHRSLTRALSKSGQIACHGDNHQAFTLNSIQVQTERLALCQKTLFEITGKYVTSFRPPQEKYSGKTLDALVNNGFGHYIAERGIDRFVPVIKQTKNTRKKLISIPRMVNDDYALWVEMEADSKSSKRLTREEIDYVQAVGGVYMFSFHTQFMDDDDYFSVVKDIAHNVYDRQAYFETTENIADWWNFRSRLISGKEVSPQEIRSYKPVVLVVDKNGKLSSHHYSAMQIISKTTSQTPQN